MARSDGSDPQHTSAFVAALASFATWGLVPIYWKLLAKVPALEIIAHRFVWTIVFLGLLLSWQERWREVIGNLRRRRSALFCLGSGVMVGLNWLLFIWAVNIGHVLETSLGYFMTPLVIWFGYAARHLRLVTIGFLQYLSPSISFILGLFVYHETFTRQHFITFLLIWIALVLVSAEAVLRWRATKRPAAEAPPESLLIEPEI
jgi:EamA domain-containing membrane protein RarD